MSEELKELADACREQPASAALLKALLRAAREEAEPGVAVRYLVEAETDAVADSTVRESASDFLMGIEEYDAAARWLEGLGGAASLKHVHALLAAGREQEAAQAYRAAMAADPGLRDNELSERFSVVQAHGRGGADVVDLHGRRISSDDELPTMPKPRIDKLMFADVGGLDEVKERIRRKIILPFQKPSLFQRFRRKAGGGILMYGPPGCGKTMLARATAGECEAEFEVIRIPDILDMFIGESEKRLAAAFEDARSSAPCVLFFDEIEAIAAKRRFDSHGSKAALVSTFLSELDGAGQDNAGVLVLAATNVPWAIDPAFRRPGRFDRVIFIPPPDRAARFEILKSHMKDRPQEAQLDLDVIAERTSGFSGADLAGVVEEAVDYAITDSLERDEGVAPVSASHLNAALSDQRATTVEWLTTARNYAKYGNEGGIYDEVADFIRKNTK
ncbi:MAG: ATP-binding protein [Rhizobiales bacterium]|nr:ATP-binding protein [Hyphomicrobiales bacterium]